MTATLPTTRSPIQARQWVQRTRSVYQSILGTKVLDSAPLEDQHRWWRMHDALKREYAIADWQYESLILKAVLALAGAAFLVAQIVPQVTPLAGLLTVASVWRAYVILTRHAPD